MTGLWFGLEGDRCYQFCRKLWTDNIWVTGENKHGAAKDDGGAGRGDRQQGDGEVEGPVVLERDKGTLDCAIREEVRLIGIQIPKEWALRSREQRHFERMCELVLVTGKEEKDTGREKSDEEDHFPVHEERSEGLEDVPHQNKQVCGKTQIAILYLYC